MQQKNRLLSLGGYTNILIAIAHLVGLLWANKMFEVTGIGKEMERLAQKHFSLPYLVTIFVAIVFFIFGLYGLSAANKFRKLPFLKPAIFAIAAIYLFRGAGELIYDIKQQEASQFLEILYSLIALFIGLLFLIGGFRKWNIGTSKK
ncbi:hypothetical protein [Flavobacterium poyangense]|uniref:hypothetical protein n=1 Tax=Flavobacterium poyangense TaxID=2204302 RepID=UPI00141EDF19|nr:hypothetical protein [Flavobacterium sp. JXAS1]